MEVEESGLGEERVADKPLGARQMKEYYDAREVVVLILRQQKQANEDPPRHHSAPSTPISPVVFCAACFRYRSNACINQREN